MRVVPWRPPHHAKWLPSRPALFHPWPGTANDGRRHSGFTAVCLSVEEAQQHFCSDQCSSKKNMCSYIEGSKTTKELIKCRENTCLKREQSAFHQMLCVQPCRSRRPTQPNLPPHVSHNLQLDNSLTQPGRQPGPRAKTLREAPLPRNCLGHHRLSTGATQMRPRQVSVYHIANVVIDFSSFGLLPRRRFICHGQCNTTPNLHRACGGDNSPGRGSEGSSSCNCCDSPPSVRPVSLPVRLAMVPLRLCPPPPG